MKPITSVLVLLAASAAFAEEAQVPAEARASIEVNGRFTVAAMACSANGVVLTNAHVADPFFFEPRLGTMPILWEGGLLSVLSVSRYADLALLDGDVGYTAAVATGAPAEGDELWWVSPTWDRRRDVARSEVRRGRVARSRAGVIFIDKESEPGSSGGCVFNSSGQVVGIMAWGVPTRDNRLSAGVVALHSPWFERLVGPLLAQAHGLPGHGGQGADEAQSD